MQTIPRKSRPVRRRVTITLDPAVHAQGQALAAADRRDFSRTVETLILEASAAAQIEADLEEKE